MGDCLTMAITFPASPADGATYTNPTTGVQYIYNATDGVWKTNVWPTNTNYLQLTGGTLTGTLTTTGLTVSNSVALPNAVITRDNLAATAKGSILQVKQTVKTDVFSEALSANTNSSTNCIEVSITPVSTSNKILVMVTIHGSSTYWGSAGSGAWQGRLVRDGSDIVRGDAAGSRNRMTFIAGDSDSFQIAENCVFTYLDSPSSASQITYGCRLDNVDNASRTMYLNRAPTDTDTNVTICRTASSITVMEVAG